jgi:hypothetical protein
MGLQSSVSHTHPPILSSSADAWDRKEGRVFFDDAKNLLVGKGPHKKEVGMLPTDDIQNDSMYLCPVTIGVAPNAITVNLDFDTGSSDLWGISLTLLYQGLKRIVFSSELPKREQTKGHTIYNPAKSPTAEQMSGATWNIGYGDGSSASGNVYTVRAPAFCSSI